MISTNTSESVKNMRKKLPLTKRLAIFGCCSAAAFAVACAPQTSQTPPSSLQQDQSSAPVSQAEAPKVSTTPTSSETSATPLPSEAESSESQAPESSAPSLAAETETSPSADNSSSRQFTLAAGLNLSLSDRLFSYKQDGNHVYYRRYNENSFAETGIFQGYAWNSGSVSEIVRLEEDGTLKVLFEDNGFGPVHPFGDRLYLTDSPYLYEARLYSTSLDGNNRVDYGIGQVLAADKDRGLLLCLGMETQDSAVSYTIFTINSSGSANTLVTLDQRPEAPIYENGEVYYGLTAADAESAGSTSASTAYLTSLYRLSLADGSSRELATAKMEAYSSVTAQVLKLLDGRLYFSCGGYAGSGNFFQGGILGSVSQTGGEITMLADEEHQTADPEFYLKRKEDGTISVICSDSSEGVGELTEIDTVTGLRQTTTADPHILEEPGTIFWADGKACVYPDASGQPVTICDGMTTDILGTADGNECQVQDMAYLQGCLYYTVLESELWPDADIGWRTGYRRVSGRAYRLPAGEKQPQLLYSY